MRRLSFPPPAPNPAPKHERSAFSTLAPGTGRALAWSRLRASAPGGGAGCSFPRSRRTPFGGTEASSPARRLEPSISHLHVNLPPPRKGNRWIPKKIASRRRLIVNSDRKVPRERRKPGRESLGRRPGRRPGRAVPRLLLLPSARRSRPGWPPHLGQRVPHPVISIV